MPGMDGTMVAGQFVLIRRWGAVTITAGPTTAAALQATLSAIGTGQSWRLGSTTRIPSHPL